MTKKKETVDAENPVITVGNNNYNFKDLTQEVQNMIALYNSWSNELVQKRTEVLKLECALRAVSQDILQGVPQPAVPDREDAVVPESLKLLDPSDPNLHRGTVKWYNDAKGFGFITPADKKEEDIYVHFSAIQSPGFKTLKEGQEVLFEYYNGPKGKQASNVRPL